MLKKLSVVLILIVVATVPSFAESYAIFGGVRGDQTMSANVYYYQEVTFITGEPIELSGTVTIPDIPDDEDDYRLTISYQLSNAEKEISLTRDVRYQVTRSTDNSLGQTIVDTKIPVGGLSESIVVAGDSYELTSFIFSDSEIEDSHAAITFDSGNTYYKKVFHKNGDEVSGEGKLTIIGESKTYIGYDSYWSKLSTRILDVAYDYQPFSEEENAWDGNATLKFSTDISSNFNYVRNDVQNTSFRGGLLKSDNSKVVLQYSYHLLDQTADEAEGMPNYISGERNLNNYTFEEATRLPVPKYKDIAGHWAEEHIFRLGSLEAFDSADFFFPDNYITREQFAMALINSIDHLPVETAAERKSEAIKQLRANAKPLPFVDVDRASLYYIFIEKAQDEQLMIGEQGLVNGEVRYQFLPTRPLTRQEAITVIVRALGIDDIAPALPYNTGYQDDGAISNWAKDAIYMAREVGIVTGYPDNTARPLELVTRAEAATMLSRLIDHLREDITVDYREKLLTNY